MALKRANRLRRRQDFQAVYQKGRRRTGNYMTVRSLMLSHPCPSTNAELAASDRPRQDAGNAPETTQIQASGNSPATRFGISISRKVSKKAVVRNRIKRQIRAVLRQMLPRISPGWLVVVVVRSSAIECNYDEILRELEHLLTEAEVLNGN